MQNCWNSAPKDRPSMTELQTALQEAFIEESLEAAKTGECVVCLSAEPVMALMPCGHRCACADAARCWKHALSVKLLCKRQKESLGGISRWRMLPSCEREPLRALNQTVPDPLHLANTHPLPFTTLQTAQLLSVLLQTFSVRARQHSVNSYVKSV